MATMATIVTPPGALLSPELFWVGGVLVALALITRNAERAGLDVATAYGAALVAILGGFIGGHLFSAATTSTGGPWWDVLAGPKASFGWIIGGTVCVITYLRSRGQPVLTFVDAASPAVALGFAIGRVGCLLNGDDYGTLWTGIGAVRFPPGTLAYAEHLARGWIAPNSPASLPVHPVQLYEAFAVFLLFLWLHRRRCTWPGQHATAMAIFYGTVRLSLELLRDDRIARLGPLSVAQTGSLGLMLFGLILWVRTNRSRPAPQPSWVLPEAS